MSTVRPVAGVLAMTLMFAWAAPAWAASPAKAPAKAAKAPLSASLDARVAALKPLPRAMQAPAPPDASTGERSFLRTPAGVVAVVAMAVGLGYAVRSAFKDNDPVESPVR
jgi:hypothetical protein